MAFAELDTDAKLQVIYDLLTEMKGAYDEFKPLIDRYKVAANANGFRQMRKALKNDG